MEKSEKKIRYKNMPNLQKTLRENKDVLIDALRIHMKIADIAEMFNMTNHLFTKVFTNEFGVSPIKYRAKLDSEIAVKLLDRAIQRATDDKSPSDAVLIFMLKNYLPFTNEGMRETSEDNEDKVVNLFSTG